MQNFLSFIKKELGELYSDREVRNISLLLLDKIANIDRNQFYGCKDMKIPENTAQKLIDAVHRLSQNEPVQYIIGETDFYGTSIIVRPGVLIPRPETEELVDIIVKKYNTGKELNIIDFCTGSGCIAIALSKNLDVELVKGYELSDEALKIARENIIKNDASVVLEKADVLNLIVKDDLKETVDLIVSNPPYVCKSEIESMEARVYDHEPKMALFVEDDNPLIFYEAIAKSGLILLKQGGEIYFEINCELGNETSGLLKSLGYVNLVVINDLSGKPRFVTAKKSIYG